MIVAASKSPGSSGGSRLSTTLPNAVHDVTLEVVPALLLFTWPLPLERLENLVVVLVRGQAQPEIEAGRRDNSHQRLNGRLSAPGLIGGHSGLGDAQPVGKFSLRQTRLQPSRKDEAAGDGRALEQT